MTVSRKDGEEGVRLQKWLAEAGLCSRREGERWILAGRLVINGEVVVHLGHRVFRGDKVLLDGKPVRRQTVSRLVVAMNKERGVITTHKDESGRPTVFDILARAPALPRLFSVGRLDFNSEGLLLFTNDGDLAHGLTHPSREVPRIYRVKLQGGLLPEHLERLKQGVELEDGPTGPMEVTLDGASPAGHAWLTMTLKEGRNREIRRIFEVLGYRVARLLRISYGGVELGDLASGDFRILPEEEVRRLREAAGLVRPALNQEAVRAVQALEETAEAPARTDVHEAGRAGHAPRQGRGCRVVPGEPGRRGRGGGGSSTRISASQARRMIHGGKETVCAVAATPGSERKDAPRGERPRTERADASRGERPRTERADSARGERSRTERADSARGERPRTERTDASRGERPRTERADVSRGERPRTERADASRGERPRTERADASRGETPRVERKDSPRGERPRGERGGPRPGGARPGGGRGRGG